MTDEKTRLSVRIGIVGAGAIGGNVGGLLAHAGYDVTLVEQWPEHVVAIKKNGLIVERGGRGTGHSPGRASHPRTPVRDDALRLGVRCREGARHGVVDHADDAVPR